MKINEEFLELIRIKEPLPAVMKEYTEIKGNSCNAHSVIARILSYIYTRNAISIAIPVVEVVMFLDFFANRRVCRFRGL